MRTDTECPLRIGTPPSYQALSCLDSPFLPINPPPPATTAGFTRRGRGGCFSWGRMGGPNVLGGVCSGG